MNRRIALSLLVLFLTTGCGLLPKEVEEPAPALEAPVKSEKTTYTVRRGAITEQVTLRARFAPVRSEELFYRSDGRVRAVYVRPGDSVQAGQLLAELFTDEASSQVARARIARERAQVALELARHQLQFRTDAATQTEVKLAELDLQVAELDVERWEQTLAESRLTAPFGGQVMAVGARPGEAVAAFTPVIRVADPAALLVEADVSETELQQVAVGQKVRLDFPGLSGAEGVVIELPDLKARAASSSTEPMRIKARPSSPVTRASMGQVGRVHVILQEKKDVLLLAKAAVRQFSGRSYVLTREPRREVDIVLGVAGETEYEVVRGLEEGDEILGR